MRLGGLMLLWVLGLEAVLPLGGATGGDGCIGEVGDLRMTDLRAFRLFWPLLWPFFWSLGASAGVTSHGSRLKQKKTKAKQKTKSKNKL